MGTVRAGELAAVLADPELSLAAKGALAIVATRPPGAVVTRAELFRLNSDSISTIDRALKELVSRGLVGNVAARRRDRSTSGVAARSH